MSLAPQQSLMITIDLVEIPEEPDFSLSYASSAYWLPDVWYQSRCRQSIDLILTSRIGIVTVSGSLSVDAASAAGAELITHSTIYEGETLIFCRLIGNR